jgi:hypothetical protein
MGLDQPAAPQPSDPPQVISAQQLQQPQPLKKPETPKKPEPPAPNPSRRLVNDDPPSRSDRRSSQAGQNRSGTLITLMTIDLDASRIALSSPEGPPVRGDVSTDLTTGFYTLHVDLNRQEWVFGAKEVKPGLRFEVVLDGAGPFDLAYPVSFPLVAQRGFQRTGSETFKSVKARVSQAVSDRQYVDAYGILDLLGEVDLYDVLDELWLDEPGVVNDLLLKAPLSALLHRRHHAAHARREEQEDAGNRIPEHPVFITALFGGR